jgi:hypothetical protein
MQEVFQNEVDDIDSFFEERFCMQNHIEQGDYSRAMCFLRITALPGKKDQGFILT